MRLLFYLSGEHPALAEAEVRALCETYGKTFITLHRDQQIALYEGEFFPELSRLSMTHKILNLDFTLQNKPFRVRVKRLRSDIDTLSMEKDIADNLQKEYGPLPVDLEHPQQEVYCIAHRNTLFTGLILLDFPYSYERRKPQYRPYFHPSSLHPRIARALVNLSRARIEVLDPFCGTGGILVEAGLMGLTVKGLDISPDMVGGSTKNLDHFSISSYELYQGDIADLPAYFPSVEAVATDMPYGKASRAVPSRDDLYATAFETIRDVTSKACIVCPEPYNFENTGFTIRESFIMRVHKSLNRHIYVLTG
jgi:tRNA (guanine10-N2)-dimethyltransferase